MPNIKPISDLRNYGEVLRDVAIGSPVFLTKNGHGRYAVMDIEEYAYELFNKWKIGSAKDQTGVLWLLSVGDRRNIKITTAEDLRYAEYILREQERGL